MTITKVIKGIIFLEGLTIGGTLLAIGLGVTATAALAVGGDLLWTFNEVVTFFTKIDSVILSLDMLLVERNINNWFEELTSLGLNLLGINLPDLFKSVVYNGDNRFMLEGLLAFFNAISAKIGDIIG
ncbi:MAG: hypothetical protein E7294_13965 [Lachnospiraceae bacterium]|nr:hypothetical protein [Lachnospiraceae bacterium]